MMLLLHMRNLLIQVILLELSQILACLFQSLSNLVTKDGFELLEGFVLGFGEEEVEEDDEDHVTNHKYQEILP